MTGNLLSDLPGLPEIHGVSSTVRHGGVGELLGTCSSAGSARAGPMIRRTAPLSPASDCTTRLWEPDGLATAPATRPLTVIDYLKLTVLSTVILSDSEHPTTGMSKGRSIPVQSQPF